MTPLPFEVLHGKYAGGDVVLTWKYPSGAPDSVYVIPVYGQGMSRRVNLGEMAERPLRNVASEFRFKFESKSLYDVTRCEFLAFLCESGINSPNVDYLLKNPAFSVRVPVGRAHIHYWVDSKKSDPGFEKHTILIESAYTIEKGILGYSYSINKRTFRTAFPDSINKGKIAFPPFFTKTGPNIKVEVVDGANAEVTSEVKRIIKLPSLFR